MKTIFLLVFPIIAFSTYLTVGIDYDLSWFPYIGFGDQSGNDRFEMCFGFRNISDVWTVKIFGTYAKNFWKGFEGFVSVESFLTPGGNGELNSLEYSERSFVYIAAAGISYSFDLGFLGVNFSLGESFVLPLGASSDTIPALKLSFGIR